MDDIKDMKRIEDETFTISRTHYIKGNLDSRRE